MFYPGPIQCYHSQVDLFWPVPFKKKINQELLLFMREKTFENLPHNQVGTGHPSTICFHTLLLYNVVCLYKCIYVQCTVYCVHNMAVKNTMTTRITRGVR
jgi:hypothetical protein